MLSSRSFTIGKTYQNSRNNIDFNKKEYLVWLNYAYDKLMKNSTILVNSEYTHNTIFNIYGIDNVIILYPPVDVDTTIRNLTLSANEEREDTVLVVSRIVPLKKIENAINLAKLLKENKIGKGMKIVENLDLYHYNYYCYIKKLLKILI